MEGDKAVKLKSVGIQGNPTIAENDLEQSKEMKEVPMEEVRKKFRPKVSDTNEIQEELSSANEKIETNEGRENETTNENSDQNSNDEVMIRMDAINEEKEEISLTNADSNHEEPRSMDAIKEEIPVTNEADADDLQQASMKKEDKSDPAYYLPDESYYDSFEYKCCQSCTCNCLTCFECADRLKCSSWKCCNCDWEKCVKSLEIPASNIIRKARSIGLEILTAVILRRLYIIPVIREIVAYAGLIIALVSFIASSVKLSKSIQSDQRQLEKTLIFIDFGISVFGLVFTTIDSFIRFRHHGFRVFKRLWRKEKVVKEGDEDNAELCNDKCPRCEGTCGKSCVIFMDVTRIIVLETIFYPNLLVQVFQFILLLVDNNYNLKMITAFTWFNTVRGLLSILILVYAHKGFILISIVFSIRKVKKDEKWNSGLFMIFFVLYMFGLMILQILMIIIIGERFHYECTNYRAIEMSGQLWYMMIFTFLMPLVGIFMFFVVHHVWAVTLPVTVTYNMIFKKIQTKGEKTKILEREIGDIDEFKKDYKKLKDFSIWKKFIYPYISPLHIILIFVYSLFFVGFFICCTNNGPLGNWQWLYVATGVFAVLINISASGVTIVWLVIITGIIVAIAVTFYIIITALVILAACLFLLLVRECEKKELS